MAFPSPADSILVRFSNHLIGCSSVKPCGVYENCGLPTLKVRQAHSKMTLSIIKPLYGSAVEQVCAGNYEGLDLRFVEIVRAFEEHERAISEICAKLEANTIDEDAAVKEAAAIAFIAYRGHELFALEFWQRGLTPAVLTCLPCLPPLSPPPLSLPPLSLPPLSHLSSQTRETP